MTTALAVAALVATSGLAGPLGDDSRNAGDTYACTWEVDREVTIPIAGVTSLSIRAGSGDLDVEGEEGLREIVVTGRVCASHEEYLEDLDVTVERASSGAPMVVTHYPESRNWRGGENTARIDLTVRIPLGLDIDVDDSSGDMVVSGTGALRVDDSSGSIRVSDVDGVLTIDDSSGNVDVRGVSGDVEIEDGSGSVDVTDVDGTVTVRDGSGGIDVRDVRGDFRVLRDGSGSIRHSGVEGRVEVPEKRRRRGR